MSTSSPRSAHIRLLGALAVATLVMAACADDDTTAPTTAPDDTGPAVIVTTTTAAPDDPEPTEPAITGPTATGPTGTGPATSEPTTTGPTTTGSPTSEPGMAGDPNVTFTEIAVLDQPIGLAARPDDPTLYVVEQPGRITAIDPVTGDTRTVLDVTDLTAARGERGLLGLTFSPDGSLAHTNHTDADSGATIVSEFPVGSDGVFDREAQRVLLEVAQPFGNHNGGHLVTGPDGLLYIGMGDGGSGGDPERFALDLTTLLGKLLRIDPTPTGDLPYTVPDDNPFVGVDGALPEIFATGLRNPWKFGFDPVTDDLWITDVGQNRFEEINHVPDSGDGSVAGAGRSFGWSAFEGTERFNADVDPEGHTDPVLTYDHSQGECSISGGAPYRGEAIPELVGGYVYSDFCSGRVFALDLAGERNPVLGQLPNVSAVLPGPDNEPYVISINGSVFRIDPA
ncbi:PQQ-dependent sugar dehydrogenase [soil metagenome]